ncbi:MAG: T9SS type A sorting domain-containing protein [Chitinophagales bacterium]|nr:T9SS type A sorting domain-containing protein [Chitinophagales bacterium]
MKQLLLFIFFLSFFNTIFSQIIQENFNTDDFKNTWTLSSNVEHALAIGKDYSKFVRFHPKYQNEHIIMPNFVTDGNAYQIKFDWNKARNNSLDSVQFQVSNDNGTSWQSIYSIINGNERNWITDSFVITLNGNTLIRLLYQSTGTFPSQYFNFDNFIVEKINLTAIKNNAQVLNCSIYPNPSTNFINIKVNSQNIDSYILQIIDNSGKIHHQQSLNSIYNILLGIDVSSYTKGNYIVNIYNDMYQYSKKIIIQ